MELLHSQEYLQATLQFAAHVQALTEKEHQLLGKSGAPLKLQNFQLVPTAGVSAVYKCIDNPLHCGLTWAALHRHIAWYCMASCES